MPINEYTCQTCGTVHVYTPYMVAHLRETMEHKCECDAVHHLTLDGATLMQPGEIKTVWLTVEPTIDGFYELLFKSGNEADRRWWWSNADHGFHFAEGHAACLTVGALSGWRGLANPPT